MPPAPRRAASALLLVASVIVAQGCSSMPMLEPRPAASRPTPDAEAEERTLTSAGDVYDDPDLGAYLASVVDRLVSDDERGTDVRDVTIVVLRDPTQSAFAMPTGHIFVHTGLLARLENEAQLAIVLARELSHVSHRRTADAAADSALERALSSIAPGIGRALANAPAGDESTSSLLSPVARLILGKRLAIAYEAAVEGYGAAAAASADTEAVERLALARYPVAEALRTFERLRRLAHAGGAAERFFYGNERALAERAQATARAAAAHPKIDEPSPGDYAGHMAVVRRDNARLELGAGRFRLAQDQLDEALAADPDDAMTHLVYGDLYRLRAQRARSIADRDELARRAQERYERCLALDPALAEAHRQLGLLYYELQRLPAAREAFARYVTLAPDAPDAARVREYLMGRP